MRRICWCKHAPFITMNTTVWNLLVRSDLLTTRCFNPLNFRCQKDPNTSTRRESGNEDGPCNEEGDRLLQWRKVLYLWTTPEGRLPDCNDWFKIRSIVRKWHYLLASHQCHAWWFSLAWLKKNQKGIIYLILGPRAWCFLCTPRPGGLCETPQSQSRSSAMAGELKLFLGLVATDASVFYRF